MHKDNTSRNSVWKYIILINRHYFAFLSSSTHKGGNEKMQKECEPLERARIAVIYDFEGSFFFSPQTVGMRQCPHWLLLECWRVATKGHLHSTTDNTKSYFLFHISKPYQHLGLKEIGSLPSISIRSCSCKYANFLQRFCKSEYVCQT